MFRTGLFVGNSFCCNAGLVLKPAEKLFVSVCSNHHCAHGAKTFSTTGGAKAGTESALPAEIPKPTRSGIQASYPRGTGGRLSFSGNVCTVLGTSGFLGMYVVSSLAKDGTQMILPYRGDPYDLRHMKMLGDLGQILFFPFNLKDEDSIRKVVRYSNVVINMIGRDYHTANYTLNDVNAEGARRIARICREMNVKRLIHFSAMNASEHPPEYFIPGGSEFLRSKALGEKYVRDEFPEAIIVRPSDICGYEDRFFFNYGHMLRRQFFSKISLLHRGNRAYKSPVNAINVGDGIKQLVADPTHDGKTFEFCGPHWYLIGDIIDWIFRLMNRERISYTRQNFDFLFTMKVNILLHLQWLHRRQVICSWDIVERTEGMSDVLTGCPTLEDLGINLHVIEDKMPFLLKLYNFHKCYKPEMDEVIKPPWPRRYPPVRVQDDVKLSEKYETVTKPTLQPAII